MKSIFYLCLLLCFFLIACSDPEEQLVVEEPPVVEDPLACDIHQTSPCDETAGAVNLRLRNATDLDFCNLELNWSRFQLGLLLAGEESCYYKAKSDAYRYPSSYKFILNDTIWGAEAIDFIGETPLEPGNYTYEIYVTNRAERFTNVRFFED